MGNMILFVGVDRAWMAPGGGVRTFSRDRSVVEMLRCGLSAALLRKRLTLK